MLTIFCAAGTAFYVGIVVLWRRATPTIELHPEYVEASAFLLDRNILRWDEIALIEDNRYPRPLFKNGRLRSYRIIGNGRPIRFNEYYTHYAELLELFNQQIAKHHIKVLIQQYPPRNAPSPRLPKQKPADRLELEVT